MPDFVIIGAMKAGTTTVFERLGQVPGVTLPVTKEPHFFSNDKVWNRGVEWYMSLFEGCAGVTGEASASYSDAATVDLVVDRMWRVLPETRILFAVRDPMARMRSHYHHEVLRTRETRPFSVAVADPSTSFVTRSLYGATLAAYLQRFDPGQILVYRLEDLDDPGTGTWQRILDHLALESAPMPTDRRNESAVRPQYTPALLWLWERNLLPTRPVPASLRRLGKRMLTRHSDARSDLLASAESPVPRELIDLLQSDQERLARLWGGSSVVSYEQ